jgi:site-specific recombinase XerC
LTAEGEIPADQLAGMSPPKLDVKVTPVLSDDQLRAMLAACKGPRLMDKRDEALIRFMAETAAALRPPSRPDLAQLVCTLITGRRRQFTRVG